MAEDENRVAVVHTIADTIAVDCPACGGTHRLFLLTDGKNGAIEDACEELRAMLNSVGAVELSIGPTGKPS